MRARASGDEVRGGGNAPRTGREISDTPDLEPMNDRCERVCSNPRFFFSILSTSTDRSFQKHTRRSRSRRPLLPLPKTRNRGRSRCAFSPARVLKERSTMLARAASSGGGTRDSPSSRRRSRIKMLTPEEDKELQVRAVPSAMRGLPGVLKVDAQSIIVVRGPRWDPPRNEARAHSRPPRAVSGLARARFHPRARPRATAFLPVATFSRALTTSSPLFSRFVLFDTPPRILMNVAHMNPRPNARSTV